VGLPDLLIGYVCFGEEETSADNTASGKNLLNNEILRKTEMTDFHD